METYLPFAPSPEDVPVEQLHALVQRCGSTRGKSWKVPKLSMVLIYIGSNEIVQLVLSTNIKSPTFPSFAMTCLSEFPMLIVLNFLRKKE